MLGLPEKTLRYNLRRTNGVYGRCLDIADMEILYAYRIRQMLADKDPVIAPIDQDDLGE